MEQPPQPPQLLKRQDGTQVQGESLLITDEGRMRRGCKLHACPFGAEVNKVTSGRHALDIGVNTPASLSDILASEPVAVPKRQKSSCGTLESDRTVGKWADVELGPTRASMDQQKRRMREQLKILNAGFKALQKENEKLFTEIDRSFSLLSEQLQKQAGNPVLLVKKFSTEFSVYSHAVLELEKQMNVKRSEITALRRKLSDVKNSVPKLVLFDSRHQTSAINNSSSSRESTKPKTLAVCGIPISNNQYEMLDNAAHNNISKTIILDGDEDDEQEEYVGLIDPRTTEGYYERIAANSVPVLDSHIVMQSDIPEDRTRGKAASESALIQNIQFKSGPSRSVQAPEEFPASVNTSASNEQAPIDFALATSINTVWNISPPTFSGHFSEGVHQWLSTMEGYFQFMDRDIAQKLAFGTTLLRDAASEWWTVYQKNRGYPENWEVFSQALLDRFGSSIRAKRAHAEILQLQQNQDTVLQYAAKFETCLAKMENYDEQMLLSIFIFGLRADLAEEVFIQRPKNILEAKKIAEEMELAQWASRNQQKKSKAARKKIRNKTQSRKCLTQRKGRQANQIDSQHQSVYRQRNSKYMDRPVGSIRDMISVV